ncbi:NAD/NADP-dependent betaine aldehyde dehydrogenase [Komagataeibacter europaeus]|uniref:NAD/NADP-dependent betaine aldehyde dehydrogenase n=1 Tax=Komagataeibacter europaeus TaxID=33995 RepID=A0A0M0EFN1_KOMEU|nr:NAD/NADP-dependent betaine aldehyde dehydrogenase [Komagataeibacter europaeus]
MDIPRFLKQVLPAPCLAGRTLWINGQWEAAASGLQFESENPATTKVVFSLAKGDVQDTHRAVSAAKAAARNWAMTEGRARTGMLLRVASLIRTHGKTLGLLDTIDSGRPISQTTGAAIESVASLFEYYAGLTDKIHGAAIPMGADRSGVVEREPLGVVGAISPWNYPLLNAATKIAPIVACGNTVVLKPAEQTSLSALFLATLLHDAGVPNGVVNIVTGLGTQAGAALVEHPDVSLVSFTGSTTTGRHIASQAGRGLKPVVLELGGKSPLIVFADADIKRAAEAAVFSTFMNMGQTCTACNRVIVASSVKRQFVEHCQQAARRLRIGNPQDPAIQIGPIVSRAQFQRVTDLTQGVDSIALDMPGYLPPEKGYFFRPMIVEHFDPDSPFARAEIFGPVMSIHEFTDTPQAWQIANDTEYGLAASVWTTSLSTAEQARRHIEAGIVWINCVHALNPNLPVCGHKNSGIGMEYGLEAISQYTRVKSTVTMFGGWTSPFA